MTEDASENNNLQEAHEVFYANVCMTCLANWVSQSLEIAENTF